MIMVSACLTGINCKYDGKNNLSPELMERLRSEPHIIVCPEMMGGLPCPRAAAEITGGDGKDVLLGLARVMTRDGEDLTDAFADGALACLLEARANGVTEAIFKDGSPSCGCNFVYDGSFSGTTRPGCGVTTAFLRQHGIKVTPL